MAIDQKVTDRTEITTLPESGMIHVVDVTNLSEDPAGSSFKISKANLQKGLTPVTYQTEALLLAVFPIPSDGTAAKVANDPDPLKNGDWAVDGGAWVQSSQTVINNLASTSVIQSLSANQGRVLNENKTEKGTYTGTTGDLKDELDAKAFNNLTTYTSVAAAEAVTPQPADGVTLKVNNVGDASENGEYSWQGGVLVANEDEYESVINYANITKGVNSKAVVDYVDPIDTNTRVFSDTDAVFTLIEDSYINSAGTLSSNASWDVKVYPVTAGEKVTIEGSQSGNVTVYAFYEDALCTVLIEKGGYINSVTAIDEMLTTPAGAFYIGLTDKLGSSDYIYLYKNELIVDYAKTLDTKIDNVDARTILYPNIDNDYTTISDNYINSAGSLASLTGWDVKVYPVAPEEKVRVEGNQSGSISLYAYYTDSACTSLVSVGQVISSETIFDTIVEVPDTANYIGVTDQNGDARYTNLHRGENVADVVESLINNSLNTIDCYGDSLTAGAGGSGTSYTSVLSSLLGGVYTVNNLGVGGEKVQTIGARQGCLPALLKSDISLPSTTSQVLLGNTTDSGLASAWDGSDVTLLLQGISSQVNPVVVDGVECTLTFTTPNYYISRNEAGTARTLYADTPLNIKSQKENNSSFVQIIYVGTNGDWSTVDELVSQIKAFINFSNTRKYIVIGLHFKYPTSMTFDEIETAMIMEFGNKYFNNRKYMIGNALADAGITPTAQDVIDIAAGVVPTSLRSDSIHFNSDGYEVLGNKIYEIGNNLGYW